MQTKTITLTNAEVQQRAQMLSRLPFNALSNGQVDAVALTLESLQEQQDRARTRLAARAKKHAGENPRSVKEAMQEHQQAVKEAGEDEKPEAPNPSDLERRFGIFLEDEEAVREAEQEILADEVEVEVYTFTRQDVPNDWVMADIQRLRWLLAPSEGDSVAPPVRTNGVRAEA